MTPRRIAFVRAGLGLKARAVLFKSMIKQSSKPPAARVSGWGATGSSDSSRPLLTSKHFAEIRRKRADLYEKLRQMTVAERERRR